MKLLQPIDSPQRAVEQLSVFIRVVGGVRMAYAGIHGSTNSGSLFFRYSNALVYQQVVDPHGLAGSLQPLLASFHLKAVGRADSPDPADGIGLLPIVEKMR